MLIGSTHNGNPACEELNIIIITPTENFDLHRLRVLTGSAVLGDTSKQIETSTPALRLGHIWFN